MKAPVLTPLLSALALACAEPNPAPTGPRVVAGPTDVERLGRNAPNDGFGAMMSAMADPNDCTGYVSANWEVIDGFVVNEPGGCYHLFDGHVVQVDLSVDVRYINGGTGQVTGVYGSPPGETRPWTWGIVGFKVNGGYQPLQSGDWYGVTSACYITLCGITVQIQTDPAYDRFEVFVGTSEGYGALTVAIQSKPLSVSISGPTNLLANKQYTFSANLQNAVSPYTILWYVKWPWNGDYQYYASGPSISFSSGVCNTSFLLKAEATAAGPRTAGTSVQRYMQGPMEGTFCLE